MMLRRQTARPGTVLVEAAFIYPVLFLLVLAVILLGLGVFRYQQVAHVAREASRWASVHGEAYEKDPLNGTPGKRAATPQDVYDNAIAPFAAGMQTAGTTTYSVTQDTSASPPTITYTGTNQGGITYSITWNMDAKGNPDKRPTRIVQVPDPITGLAKEVAVSNTVTVTVTYTWNTGLFGTLPVSSTSVNTISY